jgi:putative hydrolase
LHTDREGWQFTALFSNTARAHDLNKTRDWVVISYEKDGHENQHTVVTESHGALKGRRVVRGRERECLLFYSSRRFGENEIARDHASHP